MIGIFIGQAAITKYHKLSGLNNRNSWSHSSGVRYPRSRCQQGCSFLSAARNTLFHDFLLTSWFTGNNLWPSLACRSIIPILHSSSCGILRVCVCVCVCVCVQILPLYKDTSCIGLGGVSPYSNMTSSWLITSAMTLFPNKVEFWSVEIWGFDVWINGGRMTLRAEVQMQRLMGLPLMSQTRRAQAQEAGPPPRPRG